MTATIRAGQLRHEVVLQQFGTRVDDGYGGGAIPEVDVITVWANIEPLSGNELFQAGQFDPALSHRITIRYYAGIKPSWVVKYGTRIFDIKSIANIDERNRKIELMCVERPAP